MSEQNPAFKEVAAETFGTDTGQVSKAANEKWVAESLPGAQARRPESLEVPSKIIDPFDETPQTAETSQVSFDTYKQLYEFAQLNGFSPEALADIKAKAETEELTPN